MLVTAPNGSDLGHRRTSDRARSAGTSSGHDVSSTPPRQRRTSADSRVHKSICSGARSRTSTLRAWADEYQLAAKDCSRSSISTTRRIRRAFADLGNAADRSRRLRADLDEVDACSTCSARSRSSKSTALAPPSNTRLRKICRRRRSRRSYRDGSPAAGSTRNSSPTPDWPQEPEPIAMNSSPVPELDSELADNRRHQDRRVRVRPSAAVGERQAAIIRREAEKKRKHIAVREAHCADQRTSSSRCIPAS